MKKDIKKFGTYVTIDSMDEINEVDLEWLCLDVDADGNALLLTKDCIYCDLYHNTSNTKEEITWQNCDLKKWLNETFLSLSFSEEEQDKLINRKDENGKELGKVFLLSKEEVEKYIPDASDRKAKPTKTAKKDKDVYTQKGYCTWYLRDPSEMFEGNWTGVTPSGELDLEGGDFKRSGDKGIRPAIYVKLS